MRPLYRARKQAMPFEAEWRVSDLFAAVTLFAQALDWRSTAPLRARADEAASGGADVYYLCENGRYDTFNMKRNASDTLSATSLLRARYAALYGEQGIDALPLSRAQVRHSLQAFRERHSNDVLIENYANKTKSLTKLFRSSSRASK